MLFVTEPNRFKVLAGKILALTTSIAAAIAIRERLINHAPAEEHLFGAPVEDRLWDGSQPSSSGGEPIASAVSDLPGGRPLSRLLALSDVNTRPSGLE